MSGESFEGIVGLIKSNWPMAAQLLGAQGLQESAPELTKQAARDYIENITPDTAAQWLDGVYNSTDVGGQLADVRVPTLVLHRRDDTMFPFAGAGEIAAGIPGARLVALPGSGAISVGDDAAENMRLLVDFLDSPV